jgi:hypothetical protein
MLIVLEEVTQEGSDEQLVVLGQELLLQGDLVHET